MSIHFVCQKCAVENEFAERLAGCVVECVECGRNLILPFNGGRPIRGPQRSYWGVGSCVMCGLATLLALWDFFTGPFAYEDPVVMSLVLILYVTGVLFAVQGSQNLKQNSLSRTGLVLNAIPLVALITFLALIFCGALIEIA